jgi:hypothetical protein
VHDSYYGQYIKDETNLKFICPDDGIEREVFTEESLLAPFKKVFEVLRIKENFPLGEMFGKKFRRAFWIAILKKK